MSKHITNCKPKDFAELLNASVKTLQRWDRDKILIAKGLLPIEDIIHMTNILNLKA